MGRRVGPWPRLDAGTIEFADVKFFYPFRSGGMVRGRLVPPWPKSEFQHSTLAMCPQPGSVLCSLAIISHVFYGPIPIFSHEIFFPTRENIDLPQMVVRILFPVTCWWFQSQYVSYSFHWRREDHKSSWFSHETFPVNHHYIIIIIMKQWDSKLPMVILKAVILTKNVFRL